MKNPQTGSSDQNRFFESDELPEGWVIKSFMDLFDIEGGTQPPKSTFIYEPQPNHVRLLQIRDFGERPHPTYIRDNKKLKKCIDTDILIGRYGASVGRICTGMKGAYNVALTKVIIPKEMDRRFVFFLLQSDFFQIPILNIERSAQNGFNKGDLESIYLPTPPLAEQQRIVARVEALLTHINAARNRLNRLPLIMKKFRQAVLAAACEGRLTEGWREDNFEIQNAAELIKKIDTERQGIWQQCSKNHTIKSTQKKGYPKPQNVDVEDLIPLPESWLWVTLDQIVQENRPIVYGIIKPGPDTPDGVLYVRINEMEDGKYIDVSKLRRASKEIATKYSRASLNTGDLLISKDGTIGRTAFVPPELAGGNITQHTVRVSIHPVLDKIYILRTIQSPFSQHWLESEKKGVAQQGVNVEDFRRLPLPFPPLAEQHEIVRRVGLLFERADAFDQEVVAASRRCERLTQAVLGKAFAGKL